MFFTKISGYKNIEVSELSAVTLPLNLGNIQRHNTHLQSNMQNDLNIETVSQNLWINKIISKSSKQLYRWWQLLVLISWAFSCHHFHLIFKIQHKSHDFCSCLLLQFVFISFFSKLTIIFIFQPMAWKKYLNIYHIHFPLSLSIYIYLLYI